MGMVIGAVLTRSCPRGASSISPSLATFGNPICTCRAPSSPHLACGLNGSFFLHSLQVLRRGPACACSGIDGGEKACESLQGRAVLRRLLECSVGWNLKGGSGRGLVFKMAAQERMSRPCLLGFLANFGGLVVVRSEVSNL